MDIEKKKRPQDVYDKKNMALVTAKYKKEFVAEFKDACKTLGVTQSEIIREAMIDTVNKARGLRNGVSAHSIKHRTDLDNDN